MARLQALLIVLILLYPAVALPAEPIPATLPFTITPFGSAPSAAKHPRLFFTQAQVDSAKVRIIQDKRAADVFRRLTSNADKQLDLQIKPLDESWWQAARSMPWEQTYPQVYENTMLRPMACASPAATLATAYLLTGQARYADKSIALLMNLAGYSFEPEHYDVGMNYAIWGIEALRAYDALLPRMSAEQRKAMDACFTRMARAIAANDIYWIQHNTGGGINNHLAWHKASLGLLGLFYGRPEMVEFSLRGPRGLLPLLEDGLVDHGLWCESSLHYQFAAVAPMILLADAQQRLGIRPSLYEMTAANGRNLKQACDAMFDVLAPDGLIPPIGDAYGGRARLWKMPVYEYGWAAWGDSKYAWLINRNPEPSTLYLFIPPPPQDAPAPPIRSILLPEHGYAFLRSHSDAQYWTDQARCAFLTYDRSSVHSNADKLSLMLFQGSQMLLSDVEARATVPHAFSATVQRELNRCGLAQNTVMIDGKDQRSTSKMLRLLEFRDLPAEKRATAVDDQQILYDGVRQMRTVIMADDYVLDVFQVRATSPRQIDWIIHVMDENAALRPEGSAAETEALELPANGPWKWLRGARSFRPSGPIQLEWRSAKSHLRLQMLAPEARTGIICGFPATDQPSSGSIPMLIVRANGKTALFAALWLTGDGPDPLRLRQLEGREGRLLFEVARPGAARRHFVPILESPD